MTYRLSGAIFGVAGTVGYVIEQFQLDHSVKVSLRVQTAVPSEREFIRQKVQEAIRSVVDAAPFGWAWKWTVEVVDGVFEPPAVNQETYIRSIPVTVGLEM